MLLGIGEFIFIFPTQFYKDKKMIKYSNIGKIIVQTSVVTLPKMNSQ